MKFLTIDLYDGSMTIRSFDISDSDLKIEVVSQSRGDLATLIRIAEVVLNEHEGGTFIDTAGVGFQFSEELSEKFENRIGNLIYKV